MMNKPDIIFRRENFGAILFDPLDATFLEIDADAAACVEKYIVQKKSKLTSTLVYSSSEKQFMSELFLSFPERNRDELQVRKIETAQVENNYFPEVPLYSTPSLVDFQITEQCLLNCPQCYSSSKVNGLHVTLPDALHAIKLMHTAGVCQVAIGGGEPILHPNLSEILKGVREYGMVPNITTTGFKMEPVTLNLLTEYCGAIAMSLEGVGKKFSVRRQQGFAHFTDTVNKFTEHSANLVFQITLSANNICDLPEIVEYCLQVKKLYGVIFLSFKPAGRGEIFDRPLSTLPQELVFEKISSAVNLLRDHTRVGFDCCFAPLLADLEQSLGYASGFLIESCTGGRSSMGLTPELNVLPCTFLGNTVLGNLRENTIEEIWQSENINKFRDKLRNNSVKNGSCNSCNVSQFCLGGCGEWDLVNCAQGKN